MAMDSTAAAGTKDQTDPASTDPACTDPDKYVVVFENERVRVLEYRDSPGQRTSLHAHPDTVMHTLSGFRRRLYAGDGSTRDVEIPAGTTGWLPAQQHAGHNIGDSDTHVLFIELKSPDQAGGAAADADRASRLGPALDASPS